MDKWKSDNKPMQIAAARLALEGKNYPDATFTLRLAYGTVEGYQEDGQSVSPFTYFAGLYERAAKHGAEPPFDLPAHWIEQRRQLDLQTPFNFVSTQLRLRSRPDHRIVSEKSSACNGD